MISIRIITTAQCTVDRYTIYHNSTMTMFNRISRTPWQGSAWSCCAASRARPPPAPAPSPRPASSPAQPAARTLVWTPEWFLCRASNEGPRRCHREWAALTHNANFPSLMTFASASHFHVYLLWSQCRFQTVKVVVAAFNQEKALVGAFSVITILRMDLFEALSLTQQPTAESGG